MVSEWVQAAGTIGLAAATGVLARTSWNLYRATQLLARIEEERDRTAQRQKRKERVSRKLEVALELIRTPWDNLSPALSQGRVPGPEAKYIRELAELVDNGDQVQTRDFGPLRLAFDAANQGTRYPAESQKNLKEAFNRIKKRLGWDLQRWQNELIELSHEEPV